MAEQKVLNLNDPLVKAFNVNEGVPEKVIGREANEICRLPNTPYPKYSVEDYASDWATVGMKGIIALAKDFQSSLPPYTQSYGRMCFSEDTEVLTRDGWKLFKDVNIDYDLFATLNLDTNRFEWQKANGYLYNDYIGPMYQLKSREIDLIVTPNHRVLHYGAYSDRTKIRIKTAEELYNHYSSLSKYAQPFLPLTSLWEGQNIETFYLCEAKSQKYPIQMSGDDYCAFMGMYLAEGSTGKNQDTGTPEYIHITQRTYSKGFIPYKDLITRLFNREPSYQQDDFVVCRALLAEYVKKFGKDCYSKFIPDEIMNSTPEQIRIFLEYFELGDGHQGIRQNKNGQSIRHHYYTSSKRLADQIQELIQKVGQSAYIYTRKERVSTWTQEKVYADGTTATTVQIIKTGITYSIEARLIPDRRVRFSKITNYKGKIGCVSVPNSTLYVRRKNKPVWSGNSYMPGNTTSQLGVLQWPGLPPETLQKMAKEMIGPNLILEQRSDDIVRYSQVSRQPWFPGWRIHPVDNPTIPFSEIDTATRKDILKAESFIKNSGYGEVFSNPITRDKLLRKPFPKFLVEVIHDSLIYDGIAIWTDTNEKGEIESYCQIPAGKVRLLARPDQQQFRSIHQGELNFYGATNWAGKQPNVNPKDPPFAVTVDETNNITQSFTRKDLIWYTRNSRVDAEIGGYGHPEFEVGLTLITGFNNGIQFNCYSDDTEVLTKLGWKTFDKIDLDSDYVATINTDTGKFEWQLAYKKFWQPYNGDMYNITARSLDLLVTPNHEVLLQSKYAGGLSKVDGRKRNGSSGRNPNIERYKTLTSAELYNQLTDYQPTIWKDKESDGSKYSEYWQIPVTADWQGTEVGTKEFRHLDGTVIQLSGDDYCRFMGAYLAEGSTVYHTIQIAQCMHTKGYQPYKELLDKIQNKETHYIGHGFTLNNSELVIHLKQFGKDCYSKFIPDKIMNATPEQIKLFWDYALLGDGSLKNTNGGVYKTSRKGKFDGKRPSIGTTSKLMADQLQELAIKMGFSAYLETKESCEATVPVLIKKAVGDWEYVKESRKTITAATFYTVHLKYAKSHPFSIKKVHYDGNIGCLTVPNHTLFIRRKGWCAISKNSDLFDKNSIPKGILAIKGNFTQRQFDALGRIWDNLQRGHRTDWSLPAMQLSEKGGIEVINLEPLRKEPAYYNNMINLFMGALCTLYGMPPHRIGYKISGTSRDPRPDEDKGNFDEDVGLPALLTHLEVLINDYLITNRWPHLRFSFSGKSPKEDARLYEVSLLTKTVDERRRLVGDPPLASLVPEEAGELEQFMARVMGSAPVDPTLAAIYQTVIAAAAKAGAVNAELGIPMPGEGGGDGKGGGTGASGLGDIAGATMQNKKDPHKSEQHGHQSGVRRNSKQERANRTKPTKVPGGSKEKND